MKITLEKAAKKLAERQFVRLATRLRESAYLINISQAWQSNNEAWDGDDSCCPPRSHRCHDVEVRATCGCQGETFVGRDHLGGCWSHPAAQCPLVHGYFPDMVEAALEHLSKAIEDKTLSGNHLKHIARAIAIIKEERELIRTEDAAFRAQWMPENVTA